MKNVIGVFNPFGLIQKAGFRKTKKIRKSRKNKYRLTKHKSLRKR